MRQSTVCPSQFLICLCFQSGNCSPQGPAASSVGEVGRITTTPATSSTTTSSSSAASQPPTLRHIPPLTPLLKGSSDASSSVPCPIKPGGSGDPCPLPVKSLRPKNTNPSQDPNTVRQSWGIFIKAESSLDIRVLIKMHKRKTLHYYIESVMMTGQ